LSNPLVRRKAQPQKRTAFLAKGGLEKVGAAIGWWSSVFVGSSFNETGNFLILRLGEHLVSHHTKILARQEAANSSKNKKKTTQTIFARNQASPTFRFHHVALDSPRILITQLLHSSGTRMFPFQK
jgi:predicted peptidase